jgi:DNA-binding transcriptional ArsR family regulator
MRVGGGIRISTMVELPVLSHPRRDASAVTADFLRLISDPTRRRIFLALMDGEICNCELVDKLGLPQNLISHHLRQFRTAGLVHGRRDPQDQRWIYFRVDAVLLGQIHRELAGLFDPSSLGQRTADCPPVPTPRS